MDIRIRILIALKNYTGLSQGPSTLFLCPHFPSAGITSMHHHALLYCMASRMGWGKDWSSCLQGQHFYPLRYLWSAQVFLFPRWWEDGDGENDGDEAYIFVVIQQTAFWHLQLPLLKAFYCERHWNVVYSPYFQYLSIRNYFFPFLPVGKFMTENEWRTFQKLVLSTKQSYL